MSTKSFHKASQKNEDALLTLGSSIAESESVKEAIKETAMKVEEPLMRYFDLHDDSSPSYVLGYN